MVKKVWLIMVLLLLGLSNVFGFGTATEIDDGLGNLDIYCDVGQWYSINQLNNYPAITNIRLHISKDCLYGAINPIDNHMVTQVSISDINSNSNFQFVVDENSPSRFLQIANRYTDTPLDVHFTSEITNINISQLSLGTDNGVVYSDSPTGANYYGWVDWRYRTATQLFMTNFNQVILFDEQFIPEFFNMPPVITKNGNSVNIQYDMEVPTLQGDFTFSATTYLKQNGVIIDSLTTNNLNGGDIVDHTFTLNDFGNYELEIKMVNEQYPYEDSSIGTLMGFDFPVNSRIYNSTTQNTFQTSIEYLPLTPQNLDDGLVGYWNFNNDFNDISGSGYNFINMDMTLSAGYNNNGIDTLGMTTSAYLPYSDVIKEKGSVSVWFKTNTIGTDQNIIGNSLVYDTDFIMIRYLGNANGYYVTIGNDWYLDTTSIIDTNWHNIVLTWDELENNYYFDGQLIRNSPRIVSPNNPYYLRVGSLANGNDMFLDTPTLFDGKIDELGIWGIKLNSTQVTQLFSNCFYGDVCFNSNYNLTQVENAGTSNDMYVEYDINYQDHATSFIANSNINLGKVELKLGKFSNPLSSRVDIYTGVNNPETLIGSSYQVSSNAYLTGTLLFDWVSFYFETPIQLTNGEKYWVVLNEPTGYSNSNFYYWQYLNTGSENRIFYLNDVTWISNGYESFSYNNYKLFNLNSGIVLGCMDLNATNYNPLATQDDGSCIYAVLGCMDQNATNYNPLATQDDGSCIYAVLGCMDQNANNYNPLATQDNGSCQYTQVEQGFTIGGFMSDIGGGISGFLGGISEMLASYILMIGIIGGIIYMFYIIGRMIVEMVNKGRK